MKTQVLKMTSPVSMTVIYNDSRDEDTRYEVYKHSWEENKYGYYTKRRHLVERVGSMGRALAVCADLTNEQEFKDFQHKQMIAEFEARTGG